MATSGPGATNLVTGIATAYMDSIPIVAITCNVVKPLLGKDSFQEIDITGVTMPITKHNFMVMDVNNLAETIREAFVIAKTGRPGPVLIDIPKDVTAALCDFEPLKNPDEAVSKTALEKANLKRSLTVSVPSEEQIKAAAEMINSSERPIIYAGGGVKISGAEKELLELAEKAEIPVSESLMGRDVFPAKHRLCTWMVGMHGTNASNLGITNSDLVIAIGSRFSDRVLGDPKHFAANSKILHIDIDPAEINKNVMTDNCLVGDVKQVLTSLLPHVKKASHTEWLSQIDEWKKDVPECYGKEPKDSINPKFICECINRIAGDDTFITTEVGQHQMWAAQYIKHNAAKKFLTSGGLGTMGYGYGAAIGAQIACPDNRVIHITGDGSFHMNLNEACTAVSNNLPIITVIMNNQVLGMVYQWQTIFYDKRFSNTTPERKTDFVKLIEAFGGTGYRAETPEEFAEAMDKALMADGPVWIDCRISREERVLPMIPPTKSVESMIID